MSNEPKEILKQTSNINFKYSKGNINLLGNVFHSTYEIFLLLKGEVEFNSSKDTHKVVENELIIIPPIMYHQFKIIDNPDSYERCILEFNEHSSKRVNIKECLSGKKVIIIKKESIIYQDFMKLIAYSSNKYDKDFETLLSSLFDEIMINIKYYDNDDTLQMKTQLSPLTLKIVQYIDQHFTEQLKLENIAKDFYFSVSSLCHVFKKDLNISILQYITQKRMFTAKRLIDRNVKPSIAAQEVGYTDYSAFYRNFKKSFGFSPEESQFKP